MIPAPTADSVGTCRETTTHRPVQVGLDGDFGLGDLLALPDPGPAPRSTAAQATRARLWRLDAPPPAAPAPGSLPGATAVPDRLADAALLHRIETSGLFRPPVHTRVAGLTPELGAAWLALSAHWIDLSRSTGDLRFLNTACKLTGAVWIHRRRAGNAWGGRDMAAQLGAVGRLLGEATDRLRTRLANRVLLARPAEEDGAELSRAGFACTARARTLVLAAAGSHSAGRLVTTALASGLPITTMCWHTPATPSKPDMSSSYSSAWYPPTTPDLSPPPCVPNAVQATTAQSWDDVATTIRAADADLVLLVGMPVVPARVLDAAKLGVLNAHNGALPGLRGMDAVGWALLHNQPIVCSLHLARPAVDTGEVIAAHPVPVAPTPTLAARVKATQLRLLLAGAAHVTATGALPDSTPQPATGTQFYRMHPHLKRLLDTSPYAHDTHSRTVTSK